MTRANYFFIDRVVGGDLQTTATFDNWKDAKAAFERIGKDEFDAVLWGNQYDAEVCEILATKKPI